MGVMESSWEYIFPADQGEVKLGIEGTTSGMGKMIDRVSLAYWEWEIK